MLPEKSFAVSPQIEVSERFALVPVSVIASLTAKVRPSAVIVYVALASFADRSGVCWPSRKTLAAITNLTVDHISHATSELRDAGFLTKEVGNNGLTVYRLTVVPLRKAPDKTRSEAFQTASRPDKHEATPPVRANNPPCSCEQTGTNQGTDQKTREAAEAFTATTSDEVKPTAVKAPAVVSLSDIRQKPKTPLPDDWKLPDDFRERARKTRPDLENRLDTVAENFADYHRSKGTLSRCWASEWDRWIRRERQVDERHGRLPVVRRYPVPGREKEPPTALEQAAIEASNRKFQEQCREMGLIRQPKGLDVAGSPGRLKASPGNGHKASPLKDSLKALGVRLRS